jgi:pimeloyl-ACP methyl ester carboxylesterase
MRSRFNTVSTISLVACALSGCGGIEMASTTPRQSYADSQTSSLSCEDLSAQSKQFLERYDLTELYEESRHETALALVKVLKKRRERLAAFVLAELCYQQGAVWQGDIVLQGSYISSALVYAYSYLFDPLLSPKPNVYNPNYRRACEIYNRSLGHLVNFHSQSAQDEKNKDAFELPLLTGQVVIKKGLAELAWEPGTFEKFLVSYDYQIKGVGTQNRIYGLGTPCVAVRSPPEEDKKGLQDRYLPKIQQAYGCTIVLRFEGSVLFRDHPQSTFHGVIELYDPTKTSEITIQKQRVVLESDFTTPLVYTFENVPIPKGISGLLNVESFSDKKGLYMLQPYQKDKIPLVFIHGLLSTPSTWVRMINGILGDPALRENYQAWFFFYPTGNPILLSASILRESLLKVRQAFDPEAHDSAFEQMVLVGHSMGGVISRLQCQESGDEFWNLLSDKKLDDYPLNENQKALVRKVFWFRPVPHVRRAIFLATPHRGSTIADGIFGTIGTWLTTVPQKTVDGVMALGKVFRKGSNPALFQKYPSGIASLATDNPFNLVGAKLPFAKRTRYHSIVGNTEAAYAKDGTDGIVPYNSSHLAGALSEIVLKSGHGVHSHPAAILEVRRILRLHLKELKPWPATEKK